MARLVASFCQTGAVMDTLVITLVIAFVVLVAGGVTLLAPRVRRGRGTGVEAGPSATGTIAPPEAGTDQAVAPAPLAPAAEPAAPAAPELERPPPSAGRMVKL